MLMYRKSGASTGGTTTTIFGDISPQQKQTHQNYKLFMESAGSNYLVRNEELGLGAYGEKILESSSAFLQCNSVSRYTSNIRYYFQVNDEYVKNKVKMILFPFLYKGHWIRAMEVGRREFSYKAPLFDINAPDLYIPIMAFATYILLAGFFLGINGKFSLEALGVQFTTAIICWLLQILLLGTTLHTLGGGGGGGDVRLLDLVAYGGYSFIAASTIIIARILCDNLFLFCVVALWESLCMGVFLVKIMKRILVSELKRVDFTQYSNRRNYLLLSIAISQMPLLLWLGTRL